MRAQSRKKFRLNAKGEDGCYGQNGLDGRNGQNGQVISSSASIASIHPAYAGLSANAALVLIGVACALLDRQIATLAEAFETEGGFTERLYRTRVARRSAP